MVRGFFPPLLMAGVALVVLGALLVIQTKRVETARATIAQFELVGEQAKEREKLEAAERERLGNKREAENATAYADLDAKYRAAIAGVSKPPSGGPMRPLSEAASIVACPGGQADAAGRLERLEIGILGLLERGDKAIARAVTCKGWLDDQIAVKGAP